MKRNKFLIEMAPLLVFFFVNYKFGLVNATIALMVTTPISIAIYWYMFKKVATMPLVTAVLVLVFGGLTIYMDDTTFIKVKPTIVFALFAVGLLGALLFGRPLMKSALGETVQMTDKGWFAMSLHWGLFFIFMAVLNEYVWRNFSEDSWVTFKVFGLTLITLIFSVAQIVLIRNEIIDPDEETKPEELDQPSS